jgi:lambda family phage minor tail protein L
MSLSLDYYSKLETTAEIVLFELDGTSFGGDVFHFYAGSNEMKQPVVWQNVTYTPFPVQAEGFEFDGQNRLPQPTLTLFNIDGVIGQLIKSLNDYINARVTRHRVPYKYLDAVNFEGGVNPYADPTAEYPVDIYFVTRKAKDNNLIVQLELGPASEVTGVKVPGRKVIANVCTFTYRKEGCGYAGSMYDINNQPTTDAAKDQCPKTPTGCKCRWGATAILPYGGFPASQFMNQA